MVVDLTGGFGAFMKRVGMQWERTGRVALLILALTGFGCASLAPVTGDARPEPVVDAPAPTAPAPENEQSAPENEQSAPASRPLVVLLDDPTNRHLGILQVFSARLGRPYQIFNLADRDPGSVAASLASLAPIDTVVIGSSAYKVAGTVPGLNVFYAGVLDPGRTGQGIDALPPFGVQLDYWLTQTPDVGRLGVIGGPGLTDRMDELAQACAQRGIALERRQATSDAEMLLDFRSMVPRIDGFVFLPDESILSPRIIQQVINHGRQNGVQMLVYSPVMFNLGASLYVQPDPVMVASALIELLENPAAHTRVSQMRTKSRLSGGLEISAVAVDFSRHLIVERR